jgi:hypothetical protein
MVTYNRYDALKLAVSEIEKLGSPESYQMPGEYTNAYYSMLKKIPPTPIDFPRNIPPDNEVFFFRTWAAILVNYGINIDNKIDDLTNELITCRDSWLSNKRKLDKILNDLLEMRHSVRNFEVEVEDYLLSLSISKMPTIINQLAEPVVQILNELNNTFKRAFDLCVLKINSINSGRVTSTNILISILALIVSLLSLFVAIKHPLGI